MSRASSTSIAQASLFARRGKCFVASLPAPAPPDNKMRLATQQEPEKLKVMARRSSDRSGLFPAEVPNGPFRTCPVTTEAVAVPLHSPHVAPDKPTVVAPIAREQAVLVRRCVTDSQPKSTHRGSGMTCSSAPPAGAGNRCRRGKPCRRHGCSRRGSRHRGGRSVLLLAALFVAAGPLQPVHSHPPRHGNSCQIHRTKAGVRPGRGRSASWWSGRKSPTGVHKERENCGFFHSILHIHRIFRK
jgi:hypothetical protein